MNTHKPPQFTPGPWTVQLHNDLDTGDIRGANNEEIALCYMPDATLIAAAPAMYEALKLATIMHPHNVTFQQALAQAEGR